MHITQESDYAVRIVYCLAKCGTRRDARGISEEMCVTLRFGQAGEQRHCGKLQGQPRRL